jgi:hypothetical protein
MEQELTVWITYHDDRQIIEYNLKQNEVFRLFKGNDVCIEGKNINHLNAFYSEITTMYWVWANNKRSQYVGFCHYRRMFTHFLELDKGECQILHAQHMPSVFKHYKDAHNYKDFYDIVDILDCKYGEDNPYSYYLMNNGLFIPFCCFIMHWKDFVDLCEFLFPVLFEFDHKHNLDMDPKKYRQKAELDFPHDNIDYQQRAMSFLAERLISCFIINKLNAVCVKSITRGSN